MNLTSAEITYLRRFEFEVWFGIRGPDSVYAECMAKSPGSAGFLRDLADLATPSIQYDVMQELGDALAGGDYTRWSAQFPHTQFPWESLEALHNRVLELDPLAQPRSGDPQY